MQPVKLSLRAKSTKSSERSNLIYVPSQIHQIASSSRYAGFLAMTLALLLILQLSNIASAQTVVKHPDANQPLKDRWAWAVKEADRQNWKGSYWIGYSFVKPMKHNSFIGNFYTERRKNKPTLCEMLSLQPCVNEERVRGTSNNITINDGYTFVDDEEGTSREIPKEVAVMFEIPQNPTAEEPFRNIIVSNLSLHADLKDLPVLWLGETDDGESVLFLKSLYDKRQTEKIQQRIVSAVGLHKPNDDTFTFLSGILENSGHVEVRKDAAFWLSQAADKTADKVIDVLLNAVENDASEEVREQAIFAISQIDNERATDALIMLAKKGRNKEVRSKAMFWLGQSASKKSASTLEDIATNDENSEVQKNALFALTQLPDNRGVDPLIKIAKTHNNPRLRKEAIFWLGQTDDERALDALIEIVRK